MQFFGSYVALVTPFDKNNKVDDKKLKELVEFQIANGTLGIVPCGTTGESPTLSNDEHRHVIEVVVKAANKRVKVLAGTGSNCTDEAIEMTKFAEQAGCDGVLVVSPYYNKPTQKGLFLHFKAVADCVKIPVMIYNIASRTAVNVETPTLAELAKECRNVVAVKEASGLLEQMAAVHKAIPEMDIMSGDDALTLPLLEIGGTGVVSVVANIVPKDVSDMVKAFLAGDVKKAKELNHKLMPLVKAMFIETNPIPVKVAMGMIGLCGDAMRLPLCDMEEANKKKLEKALKDYGLLK
jgi:4-hydroxy-tetrahydrodipicolinate synthase